MKSVLERLLQFQDVIMQWIEIITGIVLKRHMMLLTKGEGNKATDPVQAVADSYA